MVNDAIYILAILGGKFLLGSRAFFLRIYIGKHLLLILIKYIHKYTIHKCVDTTANLVSINKCQKLIVH